MSNWKFKVGDQIISHSGNNKGRIIALCFGTDGHQYRIIWDKTDLTDTEHFKYFDQKVIEEFYEKVEGAK